MERKIIFCKIAWMKKYAGVSDDKPIGGGQYPAGEALNFLDGNGKCRGFVQVDENIDLEKCFKEVKATDDYVDDVLVVWLAASNDQTRIVGWYKNARVYRDVKEVMLFNEPSANTYYNIEAAATDSYLLAEEDRTFPIEWAYEDEGQKGFGESNIRCAGSELKKTTIVPEVIQYIENHDGNYANFVYDAWDIEKEIKKIEFQDDFEKLYEVGLKKVEEKKHTAALVYFKAAQKIDEPIELLRKMIDLFFNLSRYDEVIELLNKIIELEGETIESLVFIMCNYDYAENREKTIEYARKIIDFSSDSDDVLEEKKIAHLIIFDIYMYNEEFKKAQEIINELEEFLKTTCKDSEEDIDYIISPMKEYIEMQLSQAKYS